MTWVADSLQNGETVVYKGKGNSMTPIVKSGVPVILRPILRGETIDKGDIVYCKVRGYYYMHLVTAVNKKKGYQISNNHGHVNGWTARKNVYGKFVRKA